MVSLDNYLTEVLECSAHLFFKSSQGVLRRGPTGYNVRYKDWQIQNSGVTLGSSSAVVCLEQGHADLRASPVPTPISPCSPTSVNQ